MSSVVNFLCLFFVIMSKSMGFSTDEHNIKSPLRVAQCRATCLERFFNDTHQKHGESMCLNGPDCFMCWENCELLQFDFALWGSVCEEKEICFPGCQEACKFYAKTKKQIQIQPVIRTRDQGVIKIAGPLAKWPRPSNLDVRKPIIYIVMQRTQTGPWRQIIQTLDLTTRVPVSQNNFDATSTLRVLVVDSSGLLTIYSPDQKSLLRETKNNNKKTAIVMNSNVYEHSTSTKKVYVAAKWNIRKVSLIHQKVLVIGEIAWDPLTKKGVYLVTWEVHGGGLKGNLFTDSTRVTLSLWPDTIYHIQVELMSKTSSVYQFKSEIMDLDTRFAQKTVYAEEITVKPIMNSKNYNEMSNLDTDVSNSENIDIEKSTNTLTTNLFSTHEISRDFKMTTEFRLKIVLKLCSFIMLFVSFSFLLYYVISNYCIPNSSEVRPEKLVEYHDFNENESKRKPNPHQAYHDTTSNRNEIKYKLDQSKTKQTFANFGANVLSLTRQHKNTKYCLCDRSDATLLVTDDELLKKHVHKV